MTHEFMYICYAMYVQDVPEVVVDEFVWGDGKEDVVSMLEKTKVCPSVVIGADVCHPS